MNYDWLPYWKHCPKSSALNSDSLSSDIFELLAEDVGTLQIKRVLFFIFGRGYERVDPLRSSFLMVLC